MTGKEYPLRLGKSGTIFDIYDLPTDWKDKLLYFKQLKKAHWQGPSKGMIDSLLRQDVTEDREDYLDFDLSVPEPEPEPLEVARLIAQYVDPDIDVEVIYGTGQGGGLSVHVSIEGAQGPDSYIAEVRMPKQEQDSFYYPRYFSTSAIESMHSVLRLKYDITFSYDSLPDKQVFRVSGPSFNESLTEDREDYLDFDLGGPEPMSGDEARALGYYFVLSELPYDPPSGLGLYGIDKIVKENAPFWFVVKMELYSYLISAVSPTSIEPFTSVLNRVVQWEIKALRGDVETLEKWRKILDGLGVQNESLTEQDEAPARRQHRPVGQSVPPYGDANPNTHGIIAAIAHAAARRRAVKIYYRPKVTTAAGGPKAGEREAVYRPVFPYSLRTRPIHINGYDAPAVPTVTFFGYDPYAGTIKMFVVDRILSVAPSGRHYVPEFPVEFESVEQDIDSLLSEITTSGACGGYEVPLGMQPIGAKKRKKKKRKKKIEHLIDEIL